MFCLLQLLLFYVFYGVYLGGVSVFGYVVLSCVDTPMVLYSMLIFVVINLLLRMNVSLFSHQHCALPGCAATHLGSIPAVAFWIE